MKLQEPDRTSYDLRGHLLGAPLRIHPFFWLSASILGIRYYADPEAGSIGFFAFWMVSVTVCVLLHCLAQVVVARLFGIRGEVLLYGLGSLFVGLESLHPYWKRVVVLLAGLLVQFLIVAGIHFLPELMPFPQYLIEHGWQNSIATGAAMLAHFNLYWGILNLLPLLPFVGGRVVADLGESLLGRKGRNAAYLVSLVVSALLSIWVAFDLNRNADLYRFDPRFSLYLFEDGVLLLYGFILWLRGFRALLPENTLA